MKFLSWLLLIIICLAITGGLGWFKYQEIQAGIEMGKSFPEPIATVEVFVAQQSIFQPSTRVTGEVVATQSANLSNELAGRVVTVGFAPGAAVTKGQLLLALDTSEEAAQLKAAQAVQEIARLGFDRASRLVMRGAGSVEDQDSARAAYDGASANVESLAAVIAKKRITAPFDANTSLHRLEVGQYLAANSTLAMLVGAGASTWIDFALPQHQAGAVAGDIVTVLQGDNEIGQAKIIGRDAAVNKNSRNLSFRALLNPTSESDSPPLPGTLVSVEISVGELQNVVAVPATAIRRNSLGANVYVVGRNSQTRLQTEPQVNTETNAIRAQRRPVTVGSTIEFDPTTKQQMVAIQDGLAAGERIVANGAFKLRDGMRVNVLTTGPSGLGE